MTDDGMQMIDWASSDRAGPDTKSSWPPMPEYWRPTSVSATTWPWTSTAIAPLIVTIERFDRMVSGEFTTSTGRNATSALPSSHS